MLRVPISKIPLTTCRFKFKIWLDFKDSWIQLMLINRTWLLRSLNWRIRYRPVTNKLRISLIELTDYNKKLTNVIRRKHSCRTRIISFKDKMDRWIIFRVLWITLTKEIKIYNLKFLNWIFKFHNLLPCKVNWITATRIVNNRRIRLTTWMEEFKNWLLKIKIVLLCRLKMMPWMVNCRVSRILSPPSLTLLANNNLRFLKSELIEIRLYKIRIFVKPKDNS